MKHKTAMNIIDNLEWRYACKKFDPSKKLSQDQVEALKKAFNLTPTSYGLQPLKMLVIESEDIKKNLLPYAYYQAQVTTCSHLFILCIDTGFGADSVDAKFDLEKQIRGTSEEIIEKFRGQLKSIYLKKSAEQLEKESTFQAYIALGNLMTVCAELRIDSCPMEGFIPSKVDEVLRLKEKNLKSVLMLPVGFRSEEDPTNGLKKVRKPLEKVIIDLH
jgi:nitroreductase